MMRLTLFLLSLLFCFKVSSQNQKTDSITVVKVESIPSNLSSIPPAFVTPPIATNFPTIESYSSKDFNPGLVSDPFLLLQGKVPGAQIYNLGGDPNVASYVRLRGISSLMGTRQPLIVIDGVPEASIDNLDVNDIDKITILKDAASASIYGIRSGQGVVMIETKSAKTGEQLLIDASVQSAMSSAVSGIPIMSAEEFLNVGGYNDGSTTNWLNEINRQASSNIVQLGLSGRKANINYRLSGNYRSVQGILKNSGFDKLNARANVNGAFLQKKLRVNLNTSYTQLDQQFSFKEAYAFATIFNPTAPVFGNDAINPFNSDLYGGYYEYLGLFGSFNPVSVVEQNKNIGRRNLFNFSSKLSYQVSKGLQVHMLYANQNLSGYNRNFAPTTAYYGGEINRLNPDGRAIFEDADGGFNLFKAYAEKFVEYKRSKFKFSLGYAIQTDKLSNSSVSISGFDNDIIDLTSQESVDQKIAEAAERESTNSILPDVRTQGVFLSANANVLNRWYASFNLRRDQSNLLGSETNSGLFGGLSLAYEMANNSNNKNLKSLKPHLSYGITGTLPNERGLALEKFRRLTYTDGTVEERILWVANNQLTHESKKELNIGVDVSTDRLRAGLNFYTSNANNLITLNFVETAQLGFSRRNENTVDVSSQGIEFDLAYDLIKNDKTQFTSQLVFSTYKTKLNNHLEPFQLEGFFSGPGFGSTETIKLREGDEVGDIWGKVYEGVNETGGVIYADLNGDGEVRTNDPLDPLADYKVLGNALPDFEFGWTNVIRHGKWELGMLFRGAIGHSKINSNRVFNETIGNFQPVQNFVQTDLATPEVKFARFDSRQVENASFVKLDNLSLSRSFSFGTEDKKTSLRCSLVGQNLLTLTGYTGTDPEPVLADFQNDENPIELVPGMDRRVMYYPSRTVSIKIEIQL